MLWWFHHGRGGCCCYWWWRWHEDFLFLFLLSASFKAYISKRIKLHCTFIHQYFTEIHFLHLFLLVFLHFCHFDTLLSSSFHFLKFCLVAHQSWFLWSTLLSHLHLVLRCVLLLTHHTSEFLGFLMFFRKEACYTFCYRTCNIS